MSEVKENYEGLQIAIIGMSCRFPGARDTTELWQALCAGAETITTFSDEDLLANGVSATEISSPKYVKRSPVLDEIEKFDAAFFGYTPIEARVMDPQQRLLLECAWEAFEYAGYDPKTISSPISVFAGARTSTYLLHLLNNRATLDPSLRFLAELGNDVSTVATRISYVLHLRGPSYAVQTACSTSLSALHLACQSLLLGECRMALAAAAAVQVPHRVGYRSDENGIVSPDGICRPFDADANGTVFGSGVGAVLLKRLEDAIADGDTILAIVRGTATNNDGADKASYTAPSIEGQTNVILEALACAGIDADSISYLEAHGTATALGDPIEIAALANAYRASTQKKQFCRLGTIKSVMGHLDAAAGMAGIISTILAMQHKRLPALLHYSRPNPHLDLANSPFIVNTHASDWNGPRPLRAGVSSFGFGGTNAHVILEEPPETPSLEPSRALQMLTFSARSADAVDAMKHRLAKHLRAHPELPLSDIAYTLHVGRRNFDHRRVLFCQTRNEAIEILEKRDANELLEGIRESTDPAIVFMFPGQGAQYLGMSRELYASEPTFRQEMDRCFNWLRQHTHCNLKPALFPNPGDEEQAASALESTAFAQPALFVVEYALAKLWMSWGITPQAMIGHSLGEYVAACLSGVFSLEDALLLVEARGRMMQRLSGGAMLSVALPEDELVRRLDPRLDLAAINGPSMCVVSGPTHVIESFDQELRDQGLSTRRLHTSHAFHSATMDSILEEWTALVRRTRLLAPNIPYMSNLTGTWITSEQARDPRAWALHLRKPVKFGKAIDELLHDEKYSFLEVGPGNTLSALVRRNAAAKSRLVVTSMRHPQQSESELRVLHGALGRLWISGREIDWKGFYSHEKRRRVTLPTYPFERQRLWIDSTASSEIATQQVEPQPAKRRPLQEWFYLPSWKRTMLPRSNVTTTERWLVLSDRGQVSTGVIEALEKAGQDVIVAEIGVDFEWQSERLCTIDPGRADNYIALIRQLQKTNRFPQAIAHFWSVSPFEATIPESGSAEASLRLGLHSLLYLVQALGESGNTNALRMAVVTSGVHEVESQDVGVPARATILGAIRVVPREYLHITCRHVDITHGADSTQSIGVIKNVVRELLHRAPDPIVAWRENTRWTQVFEPVRLHEPMQGTESLRLGGRYLITGGLGGVGFTLAEFLGRTYKARLALVGRTALPARAEWDTWLNSHHENDPVSIRLRRLRELEGTGAELLVLNADVGDSGQMRRAMDQIIEQWGGLDGVFHAAGVAGGGIIALKTPAAMATVMAPKIVGVRNLEKILDGMPLDFIVLFSSLTAIVGEMGQIDYCAANAHLDAFAHRLSTKNRARVVSINWDMWQAEGMAVNPNLPAPLKALRELQLQMAIRPTEGMAALQHILAENTSTQIIVSTTALQDVLDQIQFLAEGKMTAILGAPGMPHKRSARPLLATAYVEPDSDIALKLVDIWQRLLGVQPIGIHDDFFELGGHSLLGAQLRNEILDAFKVNIPLRQLFEGSTIAKLAVFVTKELGKQGEQTQRPIADRLRTAFPTDKPIILEEYLRQRLVVGQNAEMSSLSKDGDLSQLDLALTTAEIQHCLKQDFQVQVYPHEIAQHRNIGELARYLVKEIDAWTNAKQRVTSAPISNWSLRPFRAASKGHSKSVAKNPGPVFVHSSPRSGSTLFRVMLAGHPKLYCPPELNLLFFDDMQQWKNNVGMGHNFDWTDEGIRFALRDSHGFEATRAEAALNELVAQNVPISDVYARLAKIVHPRLLVDKTPLYSFDENTLANAEAFFDGAKYIYLYRHPHPVMESIVRMRMDRLFGPVLFEDPDIDPHIVAEVVWTLCNRNILDFFATVDPKRCHWVRYEELVRNPEQVMKGVCEFLGIPFDTQVLAPYDGRRERMLGGLGDPNIMRHTGIEANLGDAWKKIEWPRPLDPTTAEVCNRLGYEIATQSQPVSLTKPPMTAEEAERLLANMDQLSDEQVAELLAAMSTESDSEK